MAPSFIDLIDVSPTSRNEARETSQSVEVTSAVSGQVAAGMECDIQNPYQKKDNRGCTTWSHKYPEDLEEAAENEITARYAILIRNKKSITTTLKYLVFQAPFNPFVHRWAQLTKAIDEPDDQETKNHLHKMLEAELRDVIAARADLK